MLFHYIIFQVRILHYAMQCLLSHEEQANHEVLCNKEPLTSFYTTT